MTEKPKTTLGVEKAKAFHRFNMLTLSHSRVW